MKKLFLTILLLPVLAFGSNGYPIQYGVPQTLAFKLYASDGTLDVDEVDGGTEVTIYCESSTGTTSSATATNDFADEGSYYNLDITAAEARCAVVVLDINATDREVVFYPTYGDYRAADRTQGIASGVAQSGTSTTIVLDSTTTLANDAMNNAVIFLTDGTGVGQRRLIEDWATTTDTASVSAWDTTPDSTTEYIVIPQNQATTSTVATEVVTQWSSTSCSSPTAGTYEEQLCSDIDAVLTDTGTTLDTRQQQISSNTSYPVITAETADSGSASTLVDADNLAGVGDDRFNGRAMLCVAFSTGVECECVVDLDSATGTATVSPAFSTAVTTESYTLEASPLCRLMYR